MSFSIESPAKAKLLDISVLSNKNREPDEGVGIQLTLSAKLSNGILSEFDGHLKSFLFTKGQAKNQGQLDGMESTDMPCLSSIGDKIKRLKWAEEISALRMVIDFGLGGPSNIVLDDGKADGFSIAPQEGGTVEVKFIFEAQNVPGRVFGELAPFKSRELTITIEQHEPAQEDLADKDAPKGRRGANGAKARREAAEVE